MKKTVVGLIILAALSFVGWRVYQKAGARKGGTAARPERNGAVAVVVQPVVRESIRDVRQFTGTVLPRAQFVVAPKVAGRLETLLVNIGQTVSNGQLVARLDSQEFAQQVKQARAELDVSQANVADLQSALDIAARDLERVRELRRQQVASEAEMDQIETRHRAAQAKHAVALAQVNQSEAALKAAEVRLSYTQIAAAWEGGDGARVIGERYVDEGAMLRANDPIVWVLDIGTVVGAIFVIEKDYPSIQVGQTALAETDAFPGKTFGGRIVRKAPMLKEASRQARVEIDIANPDRLLLPGMFVRVGIQFAQDDAATVVPVAALARRDEKTGVFLVDDGTMKARFVPVKLGILSGDKAEILEPPIEGRVVTLGQHLLEEGSRLTIPGDEPAAVRPAGRGADDKGGRGGGRP
jgi:RND family efflux transporter MFP subunit